MRTSDNHWIGFGELVVNAEIVEDPMSYASSRHMVREVVAERLDADHREGDVMVDDLPTPSEDPQRTRDGLAYAVSLRGRVRTTPIADGQALDEDGATRRARARFKASESTVTRWLEGDPRIRQARVTIRPGDVRRESTNASPRG